MRTSLDIPDNLFREAEAAAANRGESLQALILRALKAGLLAGEKAKGKRVEFPIVKSNEADYDVSPERLAEVLEKEDYESRARH